MNLWEKAGALYEEAIYKRFPRARVVGDKDNATPAWNVRKYSVVHIVVGCLCLVMQGLCKSQYHICKISEANVCFSRGLDS